MAKYRIEMRARRTDMSGNVVEGPKWHILRDEQAMLEVVAVGNPKSPMVDATQERAEHIMNALNEKDGRMDTDIQDRFALALFCKEYDMLNAEEREEFHANVSGLVDRQNETMAKEREEQEAQ